MVRSEVNCWVRRGGKKRDEERGEKWWRSWVRSARGEKGGEMVEKRVANMGEKRDEKQREKG